ncbi:hypothetical protein ABMA28_008972 [Loxostege sticticalis]|uniref:Uncharacterized protein n=1 Tax=Loxostege sticticalis TaxID=481309 RepID=A0ABD0SFA9_LOXSC
MTNVVMDPDKPKPLVKRPDVLRKLNAESLHLIERGLLGELPHKLRPHPVGPVRGQSNEVAVTRQPSFLSSCLPVIPDSPHSEQAGTPATSSDEESVTKLKKTFSFRDRLSRIGRFGKDKMDKHKIKTIAEDDTSSEISHRGDRSPKIDKNEHRNSKRFWIFGNKDNQEKKTTRHSNIYVRSKSFEFLPKALEEEEEEKKPEKSKRTLKTSISYVFGSSDSLDDWKSYDSFENPSNVYYDNDDGVFLKSIKEFPASESSTNNSSMSIGTSASSGIVVNMFKSQSVQDIMNEFNKAVEMFSESYLSDSEPYTRSGEVLPVAEKRKSSSFSTLPSPKVMQVNKASEISEDFKVELSRVLSVKRKSGVKSVRRGSVTDWFVLEDQATAAAKAEMNKYRRAQKKPINRVRRISSTKYCYLLRNICKNVTQYYLVAKIRDANYFGCAIKILIFLMLSEFQKLQVLQETKNKNYMTWLRLREATGRRPLPTGQLGNHWGRPMFSSGVPDGVLAPTHTKRLVFYPTKLATTPEVAGSIPSQYKHLSSDLKQLPIWAQHRKNRPSACRVTHKGFRSVPRSMDAIQNIVHMI